jgi:tRNA A37 threonylcarbamoyladenosine synthetase subunit TsaC/SUA5/YrdC
VQQLRRIKQRSSQALFAVAVADVSDVSSYCSTEQLPPGLLAALLPGPVTVLLPRRTDAAAAALAENVFGPGAMAAAAAAAPAAVVGVRVVSNEFVRRVCRTLGGGVALTSANLSGAESSLCTADFRWVAWKEEQLTHLA